jgi:hypothetical protein
VFFFPSPGLELSADGRRENEARDKNIKEENIFGRMKNP